MIYLKIRGRLGNQFFQYAAVKAYQQKFFPKEKIYIDFSDLEKLGTKESGFIDSLKYFNIDYEICKKIKSNLWQKLLIFLMKIPNTFLRLIGLNNQADIITHIYEKKIQKFLNKFGIFYMIHGYTEFNKTKAKNKIFYGNFESPKYFEDIKELLREMYTPKYQILKSNVDLYNKVKKINSVCISIRRGDFVNNQDIKKVHYVCGPEYFYKSIEIIKSKVKNPVFVVFSDDIDWVKKNMNFPESTLYESGQDTIWEKVRIMSACKNFIISNSTFSWWVEYLSDDEKKVVIAPNRWKNISYKKDVKDIDIYQDYWIRI